MVSKLTCAYFSGKLIYWWLETKLQAVVTQVQCFQLLDILWPKLGNLILSDLENLTSFELEKMKM